MSSMKCLVILGVCILFCGIQADTYTHQDALSRLKAAGISVSSSGGCSNRNDASCTSLEGIHSEAIRDLIILKEVTGCPIVVTGGTETGHGISRNPSTRSHWNGWKLDISKRGNDCTTRYIENTFTEIKPKFWQAASGNIYYDEGNHWDIQYGNPRRGRRSLTEDCLNCICKVESGCRPLPCKWDVNSNSCGYFQIKLDYYRDCYMPGKRAGESEVTAWKRCAADYDCSVQCIEAYVRRYGGRCQASSQCEKIARLHNGGPSGCSKRATLGYWNKVWNCL